MIEKTTIWKPNGHEPEHGVSSVAILPADWQGECQLQRMRILLPGKSTDERVSANQQDLVFVLAGDGAIQDGSRVEAIHRGDRLLLSAGTTYQVQNTGSDPLQYLQMSRAPKDPTK